MKKLFWIFSFCALSVTMAYSQDENYYTDNSGNDNSNNYDNNYNNGYNNQPGYQQAYADNDQSYVNFYYQLSPYGYWVNYPGYGVVWMPTHVTADFSPYVTSGHWVYTGYGWTWASDYDWGWAAFHYGRWFRDNTYGWLWMPGNDWAPAWVSWGSYDNYYCWAPMAPYAEYDAHYRPAEYSWNFVDREHFCQPNLNVYMSNRGFYNRSDYKNVSAHINIIVGSNHQGSRTGFSGPSVTEVERVTGHSIAPMAINNTKQAAATRINGNQINMYRPQIKTNVAPAVSTPQLHQQVAANKVPVQNFNPRAVAPANHPASNYNYMQGRVNEQQPVKVNPAMNSINNNIQSQRSNNPGQNMVRQQNNKSSMQPIKPAQQYTQPATQNRSAQNYQAPQRSVEQHSQPAQRQPERNFAAVQRSSVQSNRSFGGGRR